MVGLAYMISTNECSGNRLKHSWHMFQTATVSFAQRRNLLSCRCSLQRSLSHAQMFTQLVSYDDALDVIFA